MSTAALVVLVVCALIVLLAMIAAAIATPFIAVHIYRSGVNKASANPKMPAKPATITLPPGPPEPAIPDRICPTCLVQVKWSLSADRRTWSCPDCGSTIAGPNNQHRS